MARGTIWRWRAVFGAWLLLGPGPALAQDEPGVGGQPEAPAAASPSGQPPAAADPLAVARSCQPGQPCPRFADLLRYAHDPKHGPEAVTLLGRLGEARAAATLARVAVYGQTKPLQQAAQQALRVLARASAEARKAVAGVARDDPDATVRAQAQLVAGVEEATPEAGPEARRARQASRVIYGATALAEEPGSLSWTVYNIAFHQFDYTISEHFEVGLGTLIPAGLIGVLPKIKLMFSPTESVHVGVQALVPVFGIFIEDARGGAVLFGGGPLLTLGSEELLFNASLLVGGVKPFGNELFDEADAEWGMLPSVGGSWQVHRAIRLNVEVFAPIVGAATEEAGKVWLVLYGMRVTGEHLFGDISFVLPLFEDADELLKYIPIGYPLLTLGYHWR